MYLMNVTGYFLADDKLFYLPEVDASLLKLQPRAGHSRGTPYPASFIPMRSLNHTKSISPIRGTTQNSRIIPVPRIQSLLPNLTFPPTFKCTCVTVTPEFPGNVSILIVTGLVCVSATPLPHNQPRGTQTRLPQPTIGESRRHRNACTSQEAAGYVIGWVTLRHHCVTVLIFNASGQTLHRSVADPWTLSFASGQKMYIMDEVTTQLFVPHHKHSLFFLNKHKYKYIRSDSKSSTLASHNALYIRRNRSLRRSC